MKVIDDLKSKSLDELAEWIAEHGDFDGSPWMEWWDKTYCQKCPPEIGYYNGREMEFSWCEFNENKCKFFPELKETPDMKMIIAMWLQSDVEDNS